MRYDGRWKFGWKMDDVWRKIEIVFTFNIKRITMNERTQILLDRTFIFGVSTLKFLKELPEESIYKIPKMQLARSATSIGANYEEAQGASSKRDFNNRINICYREARESIYWLRVLRELYEQENFRSDFEKHLKEAEEFKKIFASIKLSTKKD